MVSIGFRNPVATRYLLPCRRYKYTVSNPAALDSVIMHRDNIAIEIAQNVSTKKRVEILEKAENMKMYVLNRRARVAQTADV